MISLGRRAAAAARTTSSSSFVTRARGGGAPRPARSLGNYPVLTRSISMSVAASLPLTMALRRGNDRAVCDAPPQTVPAAHLDHLQREDHRVEAVSRIEQLKRSMVEIWNKLCRFFMATKRIAICSTVMSSALLISPLALYSGQKEFLWTYYLNCIQYLGPTFIKLAQWASTRPDLFPEDFTSHLEKLQDSTVTYPWHIAKNTLDNSFGENWAEKLSLDTHPVGSGCIAQVYKGELLREDGSHQKVAVKLIHPHVRKLIDVDMYILRKLADFVELFPTLEYLSLRDIVEEFALNMDRQNDLRLEAKHLVKFSRNFKDSPDITFPSPIPEYVTANALVETFEEGESINMYMKDCVDTEVKHKLVKLCSVSLLEMVFKHNFVHGDLHPGNILVQTSPDHDPRLVFIDCGIVTQVKRHQFRPMLDICMALLRYDGYKAGMLLADHSSKFQKEDLDKFCSGVKSVVGRAEHLNYFEHLGGYISDVCSLSCRYRVKVVPEYFNIAMAIKVAEGIAISLDPTIEMAAEAIPVILKSQANYTLETALGKETTMSFED